MDTQGLAVITAPGGHAAVSFTAHGAIVDKDLTREDFRDALQRLRTVKNCYHAALADVVTFGREKFGDQAVEDDLKQLEFEVADCVRAAAIGQMSLEFREDSGLTNEHYYVLGQLESEDERERWAKSAGQHDLTANELKHSIAHGKVTRQSEIDQRSGRNTGIPTIDGVTYGFTQWRKRVGGEEGILGWDEGTRRHFLETVDPIVQLAETVRESLS